MKRNLIWALAALNVLLVLSLVTPLAGTAVAQGPVSRPSEYIMLPGEIVGGNSSIIWVIDGRNQQLSAFTLGQNNTLDTMAPMDLKRLFTGQ